MREGTHGIIHLLVARVHLRFDLRREVDDRHPCLVVDIPGREVHEAGVELETLRPDLLEELDIVPRAKLVAVAC